jgi:hypothetical protein
MDHLIRELDDGLRRQVIAARFEAVAAVHRATAEGLAKIAGIIGGQRTTKG